MKIQGSVRADVLVEPNGTVKSVEIKAATLFCSICPDGFAGVEMEPASHETHEMSN